MFGCPLTLLEHEAIEHFVDEVLEEGVIGPSDSPWSLLLHQQNGPDLLLLGATSAH